MCWMAAHPLRASVASSRQQGHPSCIHATTLQIGKLTAMHTDRRVGILALRALLVDTILSSQPRLKFLVVQLWLTRPSNTRSQYQRDGARWRRRIGTCHRRSSRHHNAHLSTMTPTCQSQRCNRTERRLCATATTGCLTRYAWRATAARSATSFRRNSRPRSRTLATSSRARATYRCVWLSDALCAAAFCVLLVGC
eukprot:COSAG03_NODE_516_length_7263_cov_69.317884_7_plen_196_part_00